MGQPANAMYTLPFPVLNPLANVAGAGPNMAAFQTAYCVAAYAPAAFVASYEPPPPPPPLCELGMVAPPE